MQFKSASLEMEFHTVHPELRALVADLDTWSHAQGLPEVVVTCVLRTPEDQEVIYWPRIKSQNPSYSERTARAEARKKFSWHVVASAVDIRNIQYRPPQLALVMAHIRGTRNPNDWEILQHDIGRGEHIHIARRDQAWRKQHEAIQGAVT